MPPKRGKGRAARGGGGRGEPSYNPQSAGRGRGRGFAGPGGDDIQPGVSSGHARGPAATPSPEERELPPGLVQSMTGLSLSPPPPQKQKKVPKAPRQPPGTQGRPIGLLANYFILTFKNISIFHYDVDIVFVRQYKDDSDDKPKTSKKGKSVFEEGRTAKQDTEKKVSHVEHQQKRAPGKQRCRAIITEMCKNENLKNYFPVYDGQKNLYTTKMLPINDKAGQKFIIKLKEEGKIKEFEVTIKPVEKKGGGNEISLQPLRDLYQGRTKEVPQEVIMAFDTVMCHRNPPFNQIQVGRAFFLLNDSRDALGEGLEIWYGYNQSVHLTQRGPAVIVNFAAKAFHRDGNVIDCASEIIGEDITKITRLDSRQVKQLEEALSKVKIEVTHQTFRRKYPVKGLTKTAAKDTRFKVDDKTEMSVAEYFRQYYRPLKFPHLPCLHMRTSKNTTFMPMEVCYIYKGQPKLGKLSGAMTTKMIRQTAIPPADRFKEIQENARLIEQVSGQLMSQFGLLLELRLMQFQGRVIGPPKLAYKPDGDKPSIAEPDNRGTWKIEGKRFFRSRESISWILISFSGERFCGRNVLTKFSDTLCRTALQLGMHLEKPRDIRIFTSRDKTFSALKQAKDTNVAFAVVVLSSRDLYHSYEEVKFIAEIQLKLLTQCMDDGVVVKKCNPQVATNVLLKINSKLGGVNHTLNQRPVIFSKPVIVFGADAAHSPRGYVCPSIASVVGSLDAFPARYAVTCRVQQNPDTKKLSQEIIIELKDMVKEILQAFLRNTNGKKPEKMLFFRDGVSEGQFNIVLENEIEAIQMACKETLNDFIPPLTFIVVQKRHQTRLRPQNPRDGVGRPGNVPPGTVADTDIVHPVFFDFFLCSHEGIQGTSKPAHYTVLFDENNFSSDEVQKLCYHLCHMYVRCNRSISVPAPVMYADLACTRAKKYADWYLKTHDQSVSSGASDEIRQLPDEMVEAISNMKTFESGGMFYV